MKQYSDIFYQLTRPISYLFLNHASGKVYNWKIPLFLNTLTVIFLYYLVGIDNVLKEAGLITELSAFVGNLPGFLIAALAAIATFNRPIIDQEMINAPTIDVKIGESEIKDMSLTRRDFLLRLFSYLTVLSIFLIVYQKIGFAMPVPEILQSSSQVLEWLFIGGFFMFFWQLLVLLMFGLYYLCERLNLNI